MTDTPETDSLYSDDHRPDLLQHSRQLERERDQLKAINAELLESLEEVLNDWQCGYLASKYECTSYDIARELLTKVKEAKS